MRRNRGCVVALLAFCCNAQVQPGGTLKSPDFNGDGKSDILLHLGSLIWTGLSDGSRVFKSFAVSSAASGYGRVLCGDFDGDGNTDILPLAQSRNHYNLPGLSNGNGGFVFTSAPPPYLGWLASLVDDVTVIADLNRDGKSDVLLYARNRGNAAIGISTGTSFSFTPAYFGPGYDMLRLADFNGDGIPDLLLYDRDTPRAYLGIGDGTGSFRFSWLWLSAGYDIVETGDLNGDGAADLVLYNSQTGTAHIGIAAEDGGFTFTYHLWRRGLSRIRIADVDGDGNPDLLLYSQSVGAADLGYGDGKGGFRFKNLYWGTGYDTIEAADFNGDGKADLLLYNSQTGTAYTVVSDGSPGGFTYHYHLWMRGMAVGMVQDPGQILKGPPILFEFDENVSSLSGIPPFVAAITDPKTVESVRSFIGSSFSVRYLSGNVILYRTPYNPTWSYHFLTESIGLVEGCPEGSTGRFTDPERDPLYWTLNQTSLCAVVYRSQIREIGPLRP